MFKKFIHFIKYNNLAVFVMLAVFLVGGGVFAQTEVGQDLIGEKQNRTEGVDNTLLLEAVIAEIDMNFKIERIEQDEKYYYVVYTFYDLVNENSAWQYQVREKTRKISKKSGKDIGVYLAEEFKEQYEDRVRFLSEKQFQAKEDGEEKKIEVEEYDGLIGQALNVVGKVFPGYEPVKKRVVPSPSVPVLLTTIQKSVLDGDDGTEKVAKADSLTDVYNDYIEENDPDKDGVFSVDDNCPDIYNARQYDNDNDGVGDECDNSYDIGEDSDIDKEVGGIATTSEEIATTSENVVDSATTTEPFIIDPLDDMDEASSTEEIIEDEVELEEDSSASAQDGNGLEEEAANDNESTTTEEILNVEIIELEN